MRRLQVVSSVIVLVFAAASRGAVPTGAPDQGQVRASVDALIKQFTDQKTKANLGMVQMAMDLSISFGAPAWNDGDHEACCNFYIQTAQSICDAFPAEESATPLGWAAIGDLKTALQKVKGSGDVDRNAWIIRYAFDKAAITLAAEITRGTGMMQIGTDCLNRGQTGEAEDAFGVSVKVTQEMAGLPLERLNAACALAPMALVDAEFGNHKYAEAAGELQAAVAELPALPTLTRDMHRIFGNPVIFQERLKELTAAAEKSPKDAKLQLLLGYEEYFSGKRGSAKEQFERTLELDKDNAAAKAFLSGVRGNQGAEPGDTGRSSL